MEIGNIKKMNEDKNIKKNSKGKKTDKAQELEKKLLEAENQLKRAVADYRNLEKRCEEEKKEFVKFANKDLLLHLVPAFDTLFLAGKYTADEGVKLTIKTMLEALKDVGIERVETENRDFDPIFMEVVTTDNGEENKVLEELRPGFTLYGKLIRPAQVKVGKQIES